MGRPVKVTGPRVINAWKEYYLEATGKNFNPNYSHIVMAEKLGEFYTLPQIIAAMEFYVQRNTKISYIDFIYNVDKVIHAIEDEGRALELYKRLEKETSDLVKRIKNQKLGEDN